MGSRVIKGCAVGCEMKSDQYTQFQIRSSRVPCCYICGSGGDVLYQDQRDRLFAAPGSWNFRLCSNVNCGLMWLDPMPNEEDIGKAYESYYTHELTSKKAKETRVVSSIWRRWINPVLSYISPYRRERERLFLMYLNDCKPGRLLDVGCGNGLRLAHFRQLGWDVHGQDVDPKAAAYAHDHYQLEVRVGRLKDVGFPEASFDCVVLSHVIEHMHDPLTLLKECRHLLKSGGVLVAVTPNARSFGRKHFGPRWRGLEPPRHIHLFSPEALSTLARRAGFASFHSWTT